MSQALTLHLFKKKSDVKLKNNNKKEADGKL